MNPGFDFIFGEPPDHGIGRWLHGAVVPVGTGFKLTADLIFRYSTAPAWLQNRVVIEVDRPFDPGDFVAYLKLASSGLFETASRALALSQIRDLDPADASAILEASADRIDAADQASLALLKELAGLGNQLEQVAKRERMQMAFARFRAPMHGS